MSKRSNHKTRVKQPKPVLAICYDFDKTLSPDDMQAQGFIQSVGYDVDQFWKESNRKAQEHDMDQNLAYMYKMIEEAEGNCVFNQDTLRAYGAKVKLFPGVEGWFDRINRYGAEHGVIVEHYIISSGLREMIEGTSIASAFTKIYASSFYYNDKGVATWPAQVVNYTNKTQFLFRIEKGVPEVNDQEVNDFFTPEQLRVPFRNMVYIGDSDTDIPCMKLVKLHGGYSIGVYNGEIQDKSKVFKMIRDGRIDYFARADYSEGQELDTLLTSIVDKIATDEILLRRRADCLAETRKFDQNKGDENLYQVDLRIDLDNSRSFARTHEIVQDMAEIPHWPDEEKSRLYQIALKNSQVRSILRDEDVRGFFESLIRDDHRTDDRTAEQIRSLKKLLER